MNLKDLEQIMVKHGLSIRAIPEKSRSICELCHKDMYPNGKQMYLPEFGRDMWVIEEENTHAGQFVVEEHCGVSSIVRFSGDRFFNSLEEIMEEYK